MIKTKRGKSINFIKKSVVFVIALSIYLSSNVVFSTNAANAATQNIQIVCSSTAYSSESGNLAANGTMLERNPNGLSTVSVDPNVIPLGSFLYIEGYGYAIAADTGSAIKGNKIDLYFDSSSECSDWGVKSVNVTILGDSTNS